MIEYELGRLVTWFLSGPIGGDQQISLGSPRAPVDILVYFWDPLEPPLHDPDVEAVLRIATVWNVPMACNVATADLIISSPLLDSACERTRPDHSPRAWDGTVPVEAEPAPSRVGQGTSITAARGTAGRRATGRRRRPAPGRTGVAGQTRAGRSRGPDRAAPGT